MSTAEPILSVGPAPAAPPPTPQELVDAFVKQQPEAKRIAEQLLHILTFVDALGDIKAALSSRIKMLQTPRDGGAYRLAQLFIKTEEMPEAPDWLIMLDQLLLGTALAMNFSDAALAAHFFVRTQYEFLCVPFVEHMHKLLREMAPEEAAATFGLRGRLWGETVAAVPALRALTMRELAKNYGIVVAEKQKE